MDRCAAFYRIKCNVGNAIIATARELCPIYFYIKNDCFHVPAIDRYFISRGGGEFHFYKYVFTRAKTTEGFKSFLEEFLSIQANIRGILGVGVISDDDFRVYVARHLVKIDPQSKHCLVALRRAIKRKDILMINILLQEGVPFNQTEKQLCDSLGLKCLDD